MIVLDGDLKKLALANGGVHYSAYDLFCNEQGCLNRISGVENALTTLDEDHITTAAARHLVRELRHVALDGSILIQIKNRENRKNRKFFI